MAEAYGKYGWSKVFLLFTAQVKRMFLAISVYPKLAVHFLHHKYVFLAALIINLIL